MTCLVTGAAGFIGSHLVDRLITLGYSVVGIDNMVNGQQINVSRLFLKHEDAFKGGRFKMANTDIRDIGNLHQIFYREKFDIVFHQAALGSVPRSLDFPQSTFESNVLGFNNVLNLSKEFKVKRVIYASSSSVYGGTDCVNPLNPYAASKAMNEIQAQAYGRAFGLETVGLRYFNVFGPYQNPQGDYAAVIAKWIRAIKEKEPITIYGDGMQARDFTYVDNVVDANISASLALRPAVGQVFDVGCGEPVQLKSMLSEIKLHAQRLGHELLSIPYKPARIGDVRRSCADITAARLALGYQPKIDWKEGVKRTCESALLETV
jgi:nucleoside-diphosphate-sugar epimerase